MRNYNRKSQAKYTPDALLAAVDRLNNGEKVAKDTGIPRKTLRGHKSRPQTATGAGRNITLTLAEELIVSGLEYAADAGFPRDRKDLRRMVQEFIISTERPNIVKENELGLEFRRGFQKRWKNRISRRKPECLTIFRAKALNREVSGSFHKLVKDKFDELGLRKLEGDDIAKHI